MKKQLKVATARCPVSGADKAFCGNSEEKGVLGGWWAGEAFSEELRGDL